MSISRTQVISLFVIFLFLVSPILSLPFVLVEIYNRKKYALTLLLLLFAIVAYLFPPVGDLYRYYDLYYVNFKGILYTEIFDFYIFDLLWYSLLFILANLGLSFQYSLFISILIQSYITCYFLHKYGIWDMRVSRLRLWLIIASLLYLGFWINIEMRYMLALSFFLVEVYALVNRKWRVFLSFMILSSLCHLSFVSISFLLIVLFIFKKYITLLSACFVAVFGSVLTMSIGEYLEFLDFEKAGYIVDQSNWTEDLSPLLLFFRIVLRGLPFFILGLLVLFSKSNSEYRKFALFFLALSIATISFPDLNERIRLLATAISWLFFISTIDSVSRHIQRLFVLTSVVAFLASSVITNRALRIGFYDKLFTPYALPFFDKGYTQQWIERHINDGDVVNI